MEPISNIEETEFRKAPGHLWIVGAFKLSGEIGQKLNRRWSRAGSLCMFNWPLKNYAGNLVLLARLHIAPRIVPSAVLSAVLSAEAPSGHPLAAWLVLREKQVYEIH